MNPFITKTYLSLNLDKGKSISLFSEDKYPSVHVVTINLFFIKFSIRKYIIEYDDAFLKQAKYIFPRILPENRFRNSKHTVYVAYDYFGERLGPIEQFKDFYSFGIVVNPDGYKRVLYVRKLETYIATKPGLLQTFRKGNKIFDDKWIPTFEEISRKWVDEYCKVENKKVSNDLHKAKRELGLNKLSERKKLLAYIPFVNRGSQIITLREQALQSATNFLNYSDKNVIFKSNTNGKIETIV